MDISKLTNGAKVILVAGIVFFITSFFHWFTIKHTSYGENMWHGIGFLTGLLLLALIVWQGIRLANIEFEIGVTPSMITAGLAVLLVIFTFIRFISKPGGGIASSVVDRTIWAWLGLVLAIVIVVGAWMNMKAMGESIAEMGSSMKTAAAGAAAAAKSATDKGEGDAPAAAAAPAAPVAPAAPDAPPAPPAAEPPAPDVAVEAAESVDPPASDGPPPTPA